MVKLLKSSYKMIEKFIYVCFLKKQKTLWRSKTMVDECETFYAEIRDVGNGVLGISIPKILHEAAGFKIGDKLKVMVKKVE